MAAAHDGGVFAARPPPPTARFVRRTDPTSTAMSRSTAPRQLTLTEELEKLEQSITLTLQEIDSNFSKAHRIVTSSILPIVEEYARHSNDVWEGSKVELSKHEAPSGES